LSPSAQKIPTETMRNIRLYQRQVQVQKHKEKYLMTVGAVENIQPLCTNFPRLISYLGLSKCWAIQGKDVLDNGAFYDSTVLLTLVRSASDRLQGAAGKPLFACGLSLGTSWTMILQYWIRKNCAMFTGSFVDTYIHCYRVLFVVIECRIHQCNCERSSECRTQNARRDINE
jgi:hypothetical protein